MHTQARVPGGCTEPVAQIPVEMQRAGPLPDPQNRPPQDVLRVEAGPSQSGRVRAERFGLKVGSRGHNWRCPGQGECTGRCRDPGRQGLRRSAAGEAPAPPGRRRGPLPHRSHLQRKTWGPGAAASGGICGSPARGRARPGGGAGSAPPPCHLPPPSLPFLGPRAPSSLLYPSPTLFVCPSRCDWLGGLAAPAPRGRRGRKPRRLPEAAEGKEIRGPEAALHLARARGGCLCTPSRGPRGLASSRGGVGKGESRACCGTAPGEKAGRTPAAAAFSCFSPTALWRPERLPDRGGGGDLGRPGQRQGGG